MTHANVFSERMAEAIQQLHAGEINKRRFRGKVNKLYAIMGRSKKPKTLLPSLLTSH